jgi:multicomponent Na+:H+ antiporter subunit E
MKELITYIINIFISVLAVYFIFSYFELTGNFAGNAVVFLLVYFILWLFSYFYDRSHFVKVIKALGLIFFFLKELTLASLVVAWDVITPRLNVESGLIALPLDARTNLEITLLASLVSLTPGTLSLDVSEDKRYLYIHAVYIKKGDVESLKRQIKNGFERRLLEITRTYHG